ncbi:MAG: chromate transporter [Clostridia bacterium]|nr:chromate transporter [Clostridia bacterium]
MKELPGLFLTFFKIGAFTFGGGYAMIPLIQRETVTSKKYISDDEMLDIIAISESTPGPISINAATFIGQRVAGIAGAIAATLGTVLPSFIIILAIANLLDLVHDSDIVRYAFTGIRAGVMALVVKAWISMYGKIDKNVFAYIIAGICFIAVVFFNVYAPYLILFCGAAGAVYSAVRAGGGRAK